MARGVCRYAARVVIACATGLVLATSARAQTQPPQLIDRAEAQYPDAAQTQREAAVVLRITVDASGLVTEAEIVESAGELLDAAARDAVLRSRFAPALRDGQPTAARILFRYELRPLPASEPAPAVVDEAPPALPAAPAPATNEPIEVTIAGTRTESEQLQQSAEAVQVIDTRKAKERTADLGAVLARTQGVSVRRAGGLGSSARFSLNGLDDEQIRFFLDGVPLELAGYPFGIENLPVNLVDRVEIYRGVVPIRFGADALGGAVNIVSDQSYETHAGASYQAGSFGTRRITVDGRYRDEATSIVGGGEAFFDIADNDYEVDVKASDSRGDRQWLTVRQPHDDYRAYGVSLEAGVVDVPWADRLLLRGFAASYDKELQHGVLMSLPFGEVTYGETVYGLTGRYDQALNSQLDIELVGSYAHRAIDLVDTSEWFYTWDGARTRNPIGELEDGRARDQTVWQDGVFGRALVSWDVASGHVVRGSLTPTFSTRSGEERRDVTVTARDALTAQRDLFTFVSGVEYELTLFDERLSNIAFVKDYYYDARSEEPLPGGLIRNRDALRHRQGAGDALRFRFTPWLYAKASYEYATRLPRADELFGNAVLIQGNLKLKPEISHNANVGPRVELERTPLGSFTIDINAFVRDSDQLIVLLGNDVFFTYQNIYRARSVGLENALSWQSPGRYLSLEGTFTWQDVRNVSSKGTFGMYEGDRIPNQPYLFGSWGASLRFSGLPEPRDTIEPFYGGRYVHEFFRTWASVGQSEDKDTIDTQVTHHLGVSWIVTRSFARITTTLELDNVADAKVFDNYGAQRPGRAFYVKLTGEI